MDVIVANPPWPGEGIGVRTNVRWPHRRGDKILAFPIYLSYSVAVLKKEKIKALGYDAVEREEGIWQFVESMKKHNPKLIVLEVSTPSIQYDLETAQHLKEELPNTKIVFIGPHASHFHKELITDYHFIDSCIRGEFDYAIRDIAKAILAKKSIEKIEGTTTRDKNGKVVVNKDRKPIENLDELPFPDREDFQISKYQQAFYSGKKTGLMLSSRGCPYRCTFCLWPEALFGRKFRAMSAKRVVDEIELLIKEHGIDEIFFDDDTFALSEQRVMDMCDEIKKRGIKIPWVCMGRVNTMNEKMLTAMKDAGCTQIFYGFESGSEKILEECRKGITKEEIVCAVRMTQKAGLVASGSFVFGLPSESHETVKETMNFAKKLHADFVQFTLAAPFPGTVLFDQVKNLGLLEINSWEDLDGTHGPILRTKHLTKEELAGIIRKAYIEYYSSPGVVWQNVKKARTPEDIRRIVRGAKSLMSRIIYYKK